MLLELSLGLIHKHVTERSRTQTETPTHRCSLGQRGSSTTRTRKVRNSLGHGLHPHCNRSHPRRRAGHWLVSRTFPLSLRLHWGLRATRAGATRHHQDYTWAQRATQTGATRRHRSARNFRTRRGTANTPTAIVRTHARRAGHRLVSRTRHGSAPRPAPRLPDSWQSTNVERHYARRQAPIAATECT